MISGKIGDKTIAQDELTSLFSDSKSNQQQSLQFQQQGSFNQNKMQNHFEPSNNFSQPRRDPLQFIQFRYTNPLKPQMSQDGIISTDVAKMFNNIQVPVINNLEKLLQNCETMRDSYQSLLTISQELKKGEQIKPKPTEVTNTKPTEVSNVSSGPWGRVSGSNSNTNKDSSNLSNSKNTFSNSMETGFNGTKSTYPSQNSGYQSQNSGYPSQNSGYPMQNSGYPSQNSGYPTQTNVYSSQYSGYPSSSSMKISSVVREQDVHNFIAKFQCTRATAIGYLEAFGDFNTACAEFQKNS